MTKEQKEKALAFLKDMQECTYDGVEEIRTAIEALEQQPSDDCVSREDVIRIAEQGQVQGFVWQFRKLVTMPPVTPTHGTCKDCKHCGAYICGYTCYKGHWGKISKESNYGGMGDWYCADFEKRGNENV